jgi:hypothetical protein
MSCSSESLNTEHRRDCDAVSSSSTEAATGKSWHFLVHEDSGCIVKGSDLDMLKTSVLSDTESITTGLAALHSFTFEADPPRPRSATPGSPPSVVQSFSKSGGPCDNCGRTGMRIEMRGPCRVAM